MLYKMRYQGCLYFPVPGPLLGPRHWPPICIYRSWPPICIYQPWPTICIYRPWPPIWIYWPWPPICIYRAWPTLLLPVQGLTLHKPTLSPQFLFVFTSQLWPTICITGPEPEYAFPLSSVVLAVVVLIVVVVVPLE